MDVRIDYAAHDRDETTILAAGHRTGASLGPQHSRFSAMKPTTRTTIDGAGRLVIPSDVRRAAGIRPGTLLDVRYRDGHIEIEPAPLPVRLERRGRWLVAVPEEPEEAVPPLTVETVEQTRQALALAERDQPAAPGACAAPSTCAPLHSPGHTD
jgi:AbrB family looped-hinge helix DNA binding protein